MRASSAGGLPGAAFSAQDALQVSLDGFTQGGDRGEGPWVESWTDALELIADVDAFVQGAGM